MRSPVDSLAEALETPIVNAGVSRSRRVIEAFFKVGPGEVGELHARLDQKDFQGLKRAAHRFKGGSGSIGAERLSRLCELLEHAAEEEDVDRAEALMAEVVRAFARTREHLEGERMRLKSS